MAQATSESFILEQFREFYEEVIQLKQRVGMDSWVFSETEGDNGEEADEDSLWSPTSVWKQLLSMLQRQGITARRRGGDFGEEYYREVQYLMAALADDIFVHLPWRGSQAWNSNLLESKFFKTHNAGEAVFRRLDEILAGRDPIQLDLAKLYLLALSLGFEGKFRGTADGTQRLAMYRRELLEFISERDPAYDPSAATLFPATYDSTLDQGKGQKLPYLRRWLMAFPAVLAVWFGVSWWIWSRLMSDLRPAVDRILELR